MVDCHYCLELRLLRVSTPLLLLCLLVSLSRDTPWASRVCHIPSVTYVSRRTAASSIYTTTYAQMEAEFGNSRIVSVLGLSTFVMGIAVGPMLLSPLSEFYGRRPIYLVSFLLYIIWMIPQAVAHNIATVVVTRFFPGAAGSAFLAVAGGTVGDLFAREELQAPMSIFTIAPFLAPAIGPMLGGFISYHVSWRWVHYVMIIWGAALYACLVILVPETYRKYNSAVFLPCLRPEMNCIG